MKKVSGKAEVRAEIEAQIDEFLNRGGEVTNIPSGTSGRDTEPKLSRTLFDKPPESRTYIPEVVAAIESRKQQKPNRSKPSTKTSRPRKKIIYDDFGEVVREIWLDDGN